MRVVLVGLALLLSAPLAAQEEPVKKKPAAKKQAPKKAAQAHKKPTPEQIRRFNDLEKKQKKA